MNQTKRNGWNFMRDAHKESINSESKWKTSFLELTLNLMRRSTTVFLYSIRCSEIVALPIPAKHSSSRSQLKTVSPSSSSEAIVLFPNSRIQDPLRSVASSSLAILESASTLVLQLSSSIKSPPLDSSEEKQSTTSPAIGKDFESTEPDFRRATIIGESSTCQIVENLESNALRGNLDSTENRNREAELRIVEALAKSSNRDEYQLETKEFENSVSGAHKVFDKMPALFPALELISKDTIFVPAKTELFKEVDLMNFIFYPGGESHKSKSIDCDKLVCESEQYGECDESFGELMIGRLKGNEMIAEGCKFRILQWDPGGKKEGTKRAEIDEPLVIAICYQGRKQECEFTAEFVSLLQSSPSKIVVFDPGGAGGSFLLFKCHVIQRKVQSWNLQCMVIHEEFACWVNERELCADCRKFILLQWDPGGVHLALFSHDGFLNQVQLTKAMEGCCLVSATSYKYYHGQFNLGAQS